MLVLMSKFPNDSSLSIIKAFSLSDNVQLDWSSADSALTVKRVISEVLSENEVQDKGTLSLLKKTLRDGTVVLATDNEVNVREVSTFDEAKKYIEDDRLLRKSFGKVFTIPPEGTKDEIAFTHKILDIYGIHSVRELLYCDLNVDMKIGE